jgi:hypothetical protein
MLVDHGDDAVKDDGGGSRGLLSLGRRLYSIDREEKAQTNRDVD